MPHPKKTSVNNGLKVTASKIDDLVGHLFRVLMWRNLFLIGALLFMVILTAKTTLFDLVLRKDAFHYVQKGMELSLGDWQLFQPQALGWSLFLAIFFKLGGVETIFQAMFVARWLSILLMFGAIVPLVIICRNVCSGALRPGLTLVVVLGYLTNPLIVSLAPEVYTEPLFIFLTLCSFIFLTRPSLSSKDLFFAALFAGLSYWVRANGLFQLFVIMALILLRSEWRLTTLAQQTALSVTTFFTVAAPHLLLRYNQFGSPFDYGPNSKYFVDNFAQVWDSRVPVPTFTEYLSTHGWRDYWHKFFSNGLLKVLESFPSLLDILPWLLLALTAFGLIVIGRRERIYSAVLLVVLTTIGFSLVFDVFGHVRHLVFLIPFLLLMATLAITYLPGNRFLISNVLFFSLLLFMVTDFPDLDYLNKNHVHIPEVKDTWALWSADNLEGEVALVGGSDLLRIAQHYESPAKERRAVPFNRVREWISPVRLDKFDSLEDLLAFLQGSGIRYLITDVAHAPHQPFIKDLDGPFGRNHFQRMRHFPHGDEGAQYFNVTIYKVKEKAVSETFKHSQYHIVGMAENNQTADPEDLIL